MFESQQYKESTIEFDLRTGKVKTADIISLYCTHCNASASRTGRMELALPSGDYALGALVYTPVFSALGKGLYQDQAWKGVAMMSHGGNSINQVYTDIFWDIVDQTGNVAFAMQTLFTVISQMSYYNALPRFNNHLESQRQSWEVHIVPTRSHGLAGVIAIIATHVLLLLLVSILFTRTTQYSFLLNAWPAVTQLYCTRSVENAIKQNTNITDKQVEAQLKRQDLHKATYRITFSQPELLRDERQS